MTEELNGEEDGSILVFPGATDITKRSNDNAEIDEEQSSDQLAIRSAEYPDLLRVSWNNDDQVKEVILEAALDTYGDITWHELRSGAIIAHLNRKKWIAAMINDKVRAKAYEAALISSLQPDENKPSDGDFIIADIGAGTGLLSQLALRMLPDRGKHCVSVEMEASMAALIPENETLMTVIVARSTEIELPTKAHLIISEIVDHFLLGEGVLQTSRDAAKRLLAPRGIQIPKKANLFCAIIQCSAVRRGPPPTRVSMPDTDMPDAPHLEQDDIEMLGDLLNDDESLGEINDKSPDKYNATTDKPQIFTWYRNECRGGTRSESFRVASLQASCPDFAWLSEPVHVANFDLTCPEDSIGVFLSTLPVSKTGEAHAIVYWWTLELAQGIEISNSPFILQEQDHWHQAIQPLPQPIAVKQGETLSVNGQLNDDETRIQFLLLKPFGPPPQLLAHWCCCGWHVWPCPQRCRSLPTDPADMYQSKLKASLSNLDSSATVLDVSDTAVFSLMAAFYHKSSVLCFQALCDTAEDALLASQIARVNGIEEKIIITTGEIQNIANTEMSAPALVWGDPYFHAVRGDPIATLVRLARRFRSSGAVRSLPASARLVCAPLQSPRLRRAYGAVEPLVVGCDQTKLAVAWRRTCETSLLRLTLHDYLDDLQPAADEVTALTIPNLLEIQPEAWAAMATNITLSVPADLIAIYVTYDELGGPLSAVAADHVLVKFLWPHQLNDGAFSPLHFRVLVAPDASCTINFV